MQRPFFHSRKIGYGRNPFGALTDEEWAAVAVLPPKAAQALESGFAHLQLLGPMGAGKSTALLAMQEVFKEAGRQAVYEYLPLGKRRFDTETAVLDVFLLDEAQRLSWRQRRRLVDGAGNGRLQLVLSSHEDLTRLFAQKGLVLTSVDLAGEMTVGWVTAVLDTRLAYFALPDQPRAVLSDDAVHYLCHRFGDNLRQMEYFLYEVWQRLDTPELVTRQTLESQ
jgi:hypothetical protein